MENNKKVEKVILCGAIVLAYLILSTVTLFYQSKMGVHISISYILENRFEAILMMLILMIIPYEKIYSLIKSLEDSKTIAIVSIAIYCVCAFLAIKFSADLFEWESKVAQITALLITMVAIWVLTKSFYLLKNDIALFIVDIALIIANSLVVYEITGDYYSCIITMVGLLIGWNICNFVSGRKYKILSLLASIVCGVVTYYNVFYIGKHSFLKQHTLSLDNIPVIEQYNHPFIAAYNYLGVVPFLLMIVAFIVATVAVIRSYKVLAKSRFIVMVFIYCLFATLYVYILLADLGFLPTARYLFLVDSKLYIPVIGIMIRLFITKSAVSFVYEMEDDDLDDEVLDKLISDTYSLRKSDIYIMHYFEERLKLLEKNIDNILDKLGEEKITKCDDESDELMNIDELYKQIKALYKNKKDE